MKIQSLPLLCFLSTFLVMTHDSAALDPAFTYQGRLTVHGAAFSGSAEFQATLWDTPTGGTAAFTNNPVLVIATVTNGLFVLPLNFGTQAFSAGAARWLQLEVRTTIGSFSLLSPRQPVTASPYALTAGNVAGPVSATQISGALPSANLSGTYGSAVTLNNAANSFAGDGAGLNNVNAATLNGVTSAGFWRTSGNAGGSGVFLGTTDNQPLEFRVWSSRVLRIEDNGDAPSIIAGHRFNSVSNGLFGATIAGGGNSDYPNRALADFASVLGGYGNEARGRASVAMGFHAIAGGNFSFAAGADTRAERIYSVALGNSSVASGQSAVAVGSQTLASGDSAVALGAGTVSSGVASTAMGSGTVASGDFSTAMGFVTQATGLSSTATGRGSIAAGEYSFAAGYRARANHHGSFVWSDSLIGDEFASTEPYQFLIRAYNGLGIGTRRPQADLHLYSEKNPATLRIQSTGTPGFGRIEFLSDPQGSLSEWRPAYIQSTDAGGFTGGLSFVVNGTGDANKFGEIETMRIQNGRVGIGQNAPTTLLQVGNATCNGTTWINASDRNIKSRFAPVDGRMVLEKVATLPIQSWSYTNDLSTRHIGPTAQDFEAAFGLGASKTGITTVDADGVALAAIQGLNQKLEETRRENAQLKQEMAEIKQWLAKMGGRGQ